MCACVCVCWRAGGGEAEAAGEWGVVGEEEEEAKEAAGVGVGWGGWLREIEIVARTLAKRGHPSSAARYGGGYCKWVITAVPVTPRTTWKTRRNSSPLTAPLINPRPPPLARPSVPPLRVYGPSSPPNWIAVGASVSAAAERRSGGRAWARRSSASGPHAVLVGMAMAGGQRGFWCCHNTKTGICKLPHCSATTLWILGSPGFARFFSLSAAKSQIKTVICAVYEIWILVSLFYFFFFTGLLYSISGSSTLTHMCRKESLFIILHLGYFYFLTAGFYHF